jgi:hypothetical protein
MYVGMCLYHVSNNEATVLDHLVVFSNSAHRPRREFTCA